MRTYSEDIFLLIQSMTKSEKGYFKKYTSLHGRKNDYIKLFDFIEKQKAYDENKVKKKFANEAFIKRLAPVKHYLFNTILESLHSFHQKSVERFSLNARLAHCILLQTRGLYEISFKETLKLYKEAGANEDLFITLQCLRHFSTVIDFVPPHLYRKHNLDLEGIIQKEEKVLQHSIMSYKVDAFGRKTKDYVIKHGAFFSRDSIDNFIKHINYNAADYNEADMNTATLSQYYTALGNYLQYINKFEDAYRYRIKTIEMLNQSIAQHKKWSVINYANQLSNLISIANLLKKYKEIKSYMSDANAFVNSLQNPQRDELMSLIFTKTRHIELATYIEFGDFAACAQLVEESPALIKKYKGVDFINEPYLYYFIGYYYFAIADYKKALQFFDKLYEAKYKEIGAHMLLYTKTLTLLIHIKKNSYELAASIMRSINNEKTPVPKALNALLIFIKNSIIKKGDFAFDRSQLLLLKTTTSKILKGSMEKQNLLFFDIPSWINSEIEKQPLKKIMELKPKNSN